MIQNKLRNGDGITRLMSLKYLKKRQGRRDAKARKNFIFTDVHEDTRQPTGMIRGGEGEKDRRMDELYIHKTGGYLHFMRWPGSACSTK